MKKWTTMIVSFALVLTGACFIAQTPCTYAETSESAKIEYESLVSLIKRNNAELNSVENYIMTGDIDCSNFENVFNGYNAIDKYFTGIFDGNGYTIKNLTLTSDNSFYGLFPYAKNATIKNLRLQYCDFDFSEDFVGDIYAGMLVGYGENVTFENCEISLKSESGNTVINIDKDSNINFGFLAGQLTQNSVLTSQQTKVTNCLVEGDARLTQSSNYITSLGGLVGRLKNGFVSHSIYNGNLIFVGTGDLEKYVGGIIGQAEGENTKVRNACFEGNVNATNSSSQTFNVSRGSIVGGKNASVAPNDSNFNYCYWTTLSNAGIGGSSWTTQNFINVSSISQDFLTTKNNFDPSLGDWNFEEVWLSKNGELSLQNFQIFQINLNAQADVNGIFTSKFANIETKSVEKKYNEVVKIELNYTNKDYKNWFKLESVLLNGSLSRLYTATETENGYEVFITAKANTEGTYSFVSHMLTYSGLVEAEVDDDNTEPFGGVKIQGASSTSTSLPLEFAYSSRTKTIVAEGKDKYAFANKWTLFYKEGEKWVKSTKNVTNASNAVQEIVYGREPFDREFKLVATFTKNTKEVTIDKFDKTQVKSIKIAGIEYSNTPVEVASRATITLDIVTSKATINTTKFIDDFNKSFGQADKSPMTLRTDPIVSDDEITYSFVINMAEIDSLKFVGEENKTLALAISTQKANVGGNGGLIWLYITLPIVVIAGIIITIIVVKKKRGGKGKRRTSKKSSEKKMNYRDYYI